MSEQELENLLSEYGPVVSTRILRDIDNRSKGVGFARLVDQTFISYGTVLYPNLCRS